MQLRALLRCASPIILTLAFATLAFGVGPQRTFVSAQTGNDANTANNCSLTFPCRNFNAAIGIVSAGGEVVALDSGGYGVTTINKAVTLTSPPGVYAAITAITAGSNGILVNAATTDTVVIRGLTITGLGGQEGISVSQVGSLHIEGCVISGFTANGISVVLAASGSNIYVKDSILRNNTSTGITISTSTGTVAAAIDNCRMERNGTHGIFAANNSRVTVNRTVASGNSAGGGFYALAAGAGTTTELSCEECVASANGFGFVVVTSGGTATIRAANSTAINNTSGGFVQQTTGLFESVVNNMVRGNAPDTVGTITAVGAQ